MYRTPALGDYLAQGDIFKRQCVFPYIANLQEDYLLVREGHDSPVQHTEIADAWTNDSAETVLIPAYGHQYFVILSSSCDAESPDKIPLELVLIGAALPLSMLDTEDRRQQCRRHRLIRYHYFRADEPTGFPESFVHFGLVSAVRQEALVQSKNLRILSLDHPFREDLGHRFGEFISRVALP
jgi:hypothetical protein